MQYSTANGLAFQIVVVVVSLRCFSPESVFLLSSLVLSAWSLQSLSLKICALARFKLMALAGIHWADSSAWQALQKHPNESNMLSHMSLGELHVSISCLQ